jgi:hypothetical protein
VGPIVVLGLIQYTNINKYDKIIVMCNLVICLSKIKKNNNNKKKYIYDLSRDTVESIIRFNKHYYFLIKGNLY